MPIRLEYRDSSEDNYVGRSANSVRNTALNPVTTAICASFVGMVLAIFIEWLSHGERRLLQLPSIPNRLRYIRGIAVVALTALLFGLFHWASIDLQCLDTAEVRPSLAGQKWRLVYHLALLGFLIVATVIDFDCYMIPDAITVPGTLTGVLGACLICEAQICHLWVDWSMAIPQLRGPFIPQWYVDQRILHALSWSLAGLGTGAGLTWMARQISSRVLGQEAMGFGDVTLMAMIGSFLGWQAVTLVFLIAPLTGLTIGLLIRTVSGKTYLPYGPWLSIAAAIVLFAWTHLWRHTRLIFSDWLSVATLALVGGGGFVFLLVLLRLYKSIPTRDTSIR
jgi:leader peptidase (prepilin peptidase)/N-methyltransferase